MGSSHKHPDVTIFFAMESCSRMSNHSQTLCIFDRRRTLQIKRQYHQDYRARLLDAGRAPHSLATCIPPKYYWALRMNILRTCSTNIIIRRFLDKLPCLIIITAILVARRHWFHRWDDFRLSSACKRRILWPPIILRITINQVFAQIWLTCTQNPNKPLASGQDGTARLYSKDH